MRRVDPNYKRLNQIRVIISEPSLVSAVSLCDAVGTMNKHQLHDVKKRQH